MWQIVDSSARNFNQLGIIVVFLMRPCCRRQSYSGEAGRGSIIITEAHKHTHTHAHTKTKTNRTDPYRRPQTYPQAHRRTHRDHTDTQTRTHRYTETHKHTLTHRHPLTQHGTLALRCIRIERHRQTHENKHRHMHYDTHSNCTGIHSHSPADIHKQGGRKAIP